MQRLRDVVESVFDEGYDEVASVQSFREIENWDSLKYVKLIVAIQTEFDVELGPEEIQSITSVAAIAAVLKARGIAL